MSTHDDTTPAGLHRLLLRLLDDHERMEPHHAHLCPLCQDTKRTLDLLADQLPDDDTCPGCCAPAGEAHADSCPGKDGNCPGCATAPGAAHVPYCPVGQGGTLFKPSGTAVAPGAALGLCTRTGYRCASCCAKAGQPHAENCPRAHNKPPIPLGVSSYQLLDGTTGGSYPGPVPSHDAVLRELQLTKAMLRLAELRLNTALGMPPEQIARIVRDLDGPACNDPTRRS